MEEKIIIKSEQCNVKMFRNIMLAISLTAIAYIIIFWTVNSKNYNSGLWVSIERNQGGMLITLCIAILCALIGSIYYACVSKIKLTVTNKRVYGTAAFGKRVDLPLDMISAIGTSMIFSGIAVTTASGVIKFLMIQNKDNIHSEISKLLINRQDKPITTATIKQEMPQSNADELKKYKELLDSGVISKSEFDAKKKQLLGL